jgi:hypothetical protein
VAANPSLASGAVLSAIAANLTQTANDVQQILSLLTTHTDVFGINAQVWWQIFMPHAF